LTTAALAAQPTTPRATPPAPSAQTPAPPAAQPAKQPVAPRPLLRIRLTEAKYNDFAHWVEIEGTVKNIGTKAVFSPTIRGDAYSKDGILLGQDHAFPEGQAFTHMAPGVAAGFSMLIPVKGGAINHVTVQAEKVDFETFSTDHKLMYGRRNGKGFIVRDAKEVYKAN
jgi:hypothetical protein